MNYLYQFQFGHQPHYVVAKNLAEAESRIKQEYGDYYLIERIQCLGPYVLLPKSSEENK